jgi:hypothetical protein
MARCAALLVAVLAAAAALASGEPARGADACHASRMSRTSVNLDADPAAEQIFVYATSNCQHTSFAAGVRLSDRCRGTWRRFDLSGTQQRLDRFRVVEADGSRDRPEIFFSLRGATDAEGVAKIVRLDERPHACPAPVTLFSYSPASPPFTPPTGLELASFSVAVGDYASSFRGKEVFLLETYRPGSDAEARPERRFTYLRYDRARRRYAVYATKLIQPL